MTPSPGEALIDLRERVARRAHPTTFAMLDATRNKDWTLEKVCEQYLADADAAISCVLEAMREPSEEMIQAALKACGFEEAKSSIKFFEDAGIIKVRGIKWTGIIEWKAMLAAFARTVGR